MGVYVFLGWFVALVACVGAGVGLVAVRGSSGLGRAALVLLGGLLLGGFVSAWLGAAEGVYAPLSPGLLVSVGIGAAGLSCIGLGCLGFRRRHRPGTCRTCGYDLSGHAERDACPECGARPDARP